jgi:hypothetical protein
MKRIRLLVPVVALVLALLPTSASASTTYGESVLGFETGVPQSTAECPAPNSVSPFAGIAQGTLNGIAVIGVCHTPLNPGATILFGIFALTNGKTSVTGIFAPNGMVSFVSTSVIDSFCIQKYAVSGGLLPSGNFAGTLLHYGSWTGTTCNVFFATISGNAVLTV